METLGDYLYLLFPVKYISALLPHAEIKITGYYF